MCAKMILTLLAISLGYANSAVTFDQRQNGESNVQVDLKNLQIFALMKSGKEEYVDYDYAYDYSEMTIKPQNGTTPKPLNATTASDAVSDNTTAATTLITEPTTSPLKYNNSLSLETAEVTLYPAVNESTTTLKSFEIVTTEPPESASDKNMTTTSSTAGTSSTSSTAATTTNCRKGFVINQKGDCELKLQGTGNALLKLVKLSQKLKLRRENRRNQDETVTKQPTTVI